MNRWLYVVAALVFVVGLFLAARSVRQHANDTEDVMASATYQRFALRRQAVDSMRAALLNVAVVESAFVADSGRPTTRFTTGYYGFVHREGTDVYLTIQRDRWVAQARSRFTSMRCSLTAMVDDTSATYWTYHPGQPICADWNAESTAVQARELAAWRAAHPATTDAAATAPPSADTVVLVHRGNEPEGQP